MEQERRNAIIEMARRGHGPAYIAKTLKYNRSTVYNVYNSFKAEGKVKRKAHKYRSDKKEPPHFWLA